MHATRTVRGSAGALQAVGSGRALVQGGWTSLVGAWHTAGAEAGAGASTAAGAVTGAGAGADATTGAGRDSAATDGAGAGAEKAVGAGAGAGSDRAATVGAGAGAGREKDVTAGPGAGASAVVGAGAGTVAADALGLQGRGEPLSAMSAVHECWYICSSFFLESGTGRMLSIQFICTTYMVATMGTLSSMHLALHWQRRRNGEVRAAAYTASAEAARAGAAWPAGAPLLTRADSGSGAPAGTGAGAGANASIIRLWP